MTMTMHLFKNAPAVAAALGMAVSLSASCQNEPVTTMQPEPESTLVSYLKDEVATVVRTGFVPADEIAAYALMMVAEEESDSTLLPLAEQFTTIALADHKREQESWTTPTDCDRLDAAFAALEKGGIVSRQNFSCCGSCGAGEILDEMESVKEAGGDVRGYTFFHVQDTEGAVDRGGLYLNYGATKESEKAALSIGHEIVAAIQQQGLQVTWDGTWETRIHVAMDWKKRR